MVGILLGLSGAGVAARSLALLLSRGRPQRAVAPAFVLSGPYLRTRNPFLGGVIIALVGLSVAAMSNSLGLLVGAVAAGAHVWVVQIEEPRLRARFGRFYEAYTRRVPRWLPGPASASDPVIGTGY